MKTKFKLLPIAAVVAAVLSPFAASTASADDALTFSGYARYGALYNTRDAGPDWVGAGTMNHGVGRLGNESNGGEFQFTKKFEGENGSKWEVAMMAENWWASSIYVDADGDGVDDNSYSPEYGNIAVKKFYAKGTNIFASQPGLIIWAGRDFHQRPQTSLSDYFWMTHDGQGGGFENLDLGGAKFNLSFVGQAGESDTWKPTADNGQYAVTSKLHGIKLSDDIGLDIYANLGFADNTKDTNSDETAFQVATVLNAKGHKLTIRYADNTTDTVYSIVDGQTALFAALEGGFSFSDQLKMDYHVAYQTIDEDGNANDKDNYSLIVRPMYAWDDTHSTWLEAGYEYLETGGADIDSWKVTVSQNVAISSVPWGRPMVRFYSTVGETDSLGTLTFGAMFEAWW